MKRLLAILLAAACAVSTVGCAAGEPAGHVELPSEVTELAIPEAFAMANYPQDDQYYDAKTGEWDDAAWERDYDAWRAAYDAKTADMADTTEGLDGRFAAIIAALLAGSGGENRVCSPLNVYLALAMLAEVTDGGSRTQILNALGADSMEALRTTAAALWNENSWDDGRVTSLLANSFWLRSGDSYSTDTLNRLATDHHAAAFSGEMGSEDYDKALQSWINENTGNLLTEQAGALKLNPETVLALVSTICFRANWTDKFGEDATSAETFRAPSGDVTCDFMHSSQNGTVYYGDGFSAIGLGFQGSGSMWLLRPDDGKTPEDLLASEDALGFMTANGGWSQTQFAKIALSLPKFDAASDLDLTGALTALGVTDVFDAATADFSPLKPDADDLALTQAKHAARVKIDEEGCEAAAFTFFGVEATAMLEEPQTVEFRLDRPFLFVITGLDGAPLFAGVVNQPA